MKKIVIYLLLGLVFLATSAYCYSWWYSQPRNVVDRIVGVDTPLFSEVLYTKNESSWQDAHLAYAFRVSGEFSDRFILNCSQRNFELSKYDYKKSSLILDEALKDKSPEVGRNKACAKSYI